MAPQRVKPTGIHPNRLLSNRDRFWADYSLNRDDVEYRHAIASVRFELESIQRPRARRTMSLPPSKCKPWPDKAPNVKATSNRTKAKGKPWLRRILDGVQNTASQCKGRIARVRAWRPSPRLKRTVMQIAAATLAGAVYLMINNEYARVRAAQPSIIMQFSGSNAPTWMHADSPARILGMTDPIAPTIVNKLAYLKAFRKFNIKFHPDRAATNNLNSTVAFAVYLRGLEAKRALDFFYVNPYCSHQKMAMDIFSVSDDGLPSYASPCRCTYPRAVLEATQRATVPFFLQTAPPQTMEELARYCPPCDFATAADNWAEFSPENRPPNLSRLRKALPWSKVFEDPRILPFKLDKLPREDMDGAHWDHETQQRWEDSGWAIGLDWREVRDCVSTMKFSVSGWDLEHQDTDEDGYVTNDWLKDRMASYGQDSGQGSQQANGDA
ncbi:hypothetical protein BKA66DRAFT_478925 [Pyrenochaeta sp. MPI-SDFR-AT-0127]|nr:hypothetical protein BKA66DRAFT_478925 [Pyrenochaeta sp. MPI-SDFR-AT-0127]